jgi:hypothetical protein
MDPVADSCWFHCDSRALDGALPSPVANPKLAIRLLPLQRTGHLRLVLDDLVRRLRLPAAAKALTSIAAREHGVLRRRHARYGIPNVAGWHLSNSPKQLAKRGHQHRVARCNGHSRQSRFAIGAGGSGFRVTPICESGNGISRLLDHARLVRLRCAQGFGAIETTARRGESEHLLGPARDAHADRNSAVKLATGRSRISLKINLEWRPSASRRPCSRDCWVHFGGPFVGCQAAFKCWPSLLNLPA